MRSSKRRLGTGTLIGLILVIGGGALMACSPSPEEQAATAAAQTAAAATNTPAPTPTPTLTPTSTSTPTPTPVPFDLSVQVIGEDDLPIAGADLNLLEAFEDEPQKATDSGGRAVWSDLPGQAITLEVKAQGYSPTSVTEMIERGPNELSITLERDPYGLLPSEACAPGERLLYIEDFQDGEAQGWPEIEFRAQGWDLLPHPDEPGDMVILKPGGNIAEARLQDLTFDNAVWRVRSMLHGMTSTNFQWLQVEDPYEVDGNQVAWSWYELGFYNFNIDVYRTQAPDLSFALTNVERTSKRDVWHTIEISTYEGLLEIWIDGSQFMTYRDPKPLPGGRLTIVVRASSDAESVAYVNDISVCELTAPFVPLPSPEPQS